MDIYSIDLMTRFRDVYVTDDMTILDVGSQRIRKQPTYRPLFKNYTGMDIVPGPNVDIVGYENLGVYDVVICGQVMEHVERPWEFLAQLKKYYRKYICIIAPNRAREHRVPIDTYRYFPDGMRALFKYADIKELEIFKERYNTVGIGTK